MGHPRWLGLALDAFTRKMVAVSVMTTAMVGEAAEVARKEIPPMTHLTVNVLEAALVRGTNQSAGSLTKYPTATGINRRALVVGHINRLLAKLRTGAVTKILTRIVRVLLSKNFERDPHPIPHHRGLVMPIQCPTPSRSLGQGHNRDRGHGRVRNHLPILWQKCLVNQDI